MLSGGETTTMGGRRTQPRSGHALADEFKNPLLEGDKLKLPRDKGLFIYLYLLAGVPGRLI